MRSCDVVAWADTEHGAVVCLDCAAVGEPEREGWAAVFADSEWDSFPTCDRCHEAIYDVGLTRDGIEYHKEWLYGASGILGAFAAEALAATASPLVDALSAHGVRVEEVRRSRGPGQELVMYVPEGYACLDGEHDFEGSDECWTCGAQQPE